LHYTAIGIGLNFLQLNKNPLPTKITRVVNFNIQIQ